MSVMVTGGAGYIGSHVVRLLRERGDEVVIVDDLSNGIPERVAGLPLERIDLSAPEAEASLTDAMLTHGVDSVIHFAAMKQVGESVERPLWYYRQNVAGLANLLAAIGDAGVNRLVFSSSAAVYGMPDRLTVPEDIDCRPINPYGQTKLIGEWMIDDVTAVTDLRAIKLRYFNVAGAGWPDLADTAVMNLVPIVLERLRAGKRPVIFGDDYATEDGTCIRDYIHVKDLADAHIAALDALAAGTNEHTSFNVGTGQGASVKEVIEALSDALGEPIDAEIGARRAGDPPRLVADTSSIAAELGWKAELGLADIATSAVEIERQLHG